MYLHTLICNMKYVPQNRHDVSHIYTTLTEIMYMTNQQTDSIMLMEESQLRTNHTNTHWFTVPSAQSHVFAPLAVTVTLPTLALSATKPRRHRVLH